MTFEEKLERLRERHEALTETAELLLRSALGHDAAFAEMRNQAKEHEARLAQLDDRLERLLRIAEIHERPITGLEGGVQ